MNKTIPEIRRYDVRDQSNSSPARKGQWLGTFIVTHDGLVQVFSDYGKYAHWWSSTGCDDIREFLLGIDDGYLLGKFSHGREYYGKETEQAIKEYILKRRRRQDSTAEQARDEWTKLNDHDLSDEMGFNDWQRETEIECAWEFGHYDSPRQAVAFTERVWPVFCDMMRKEMAEEKLAQEHMEKFSDGRLHAKAMVAIMEWIENRTGTKGHDELVFSAMNTLSLIFKKKDACNGT